MPKHNAELLTDLCISTILSSYNFKENQELSMNSNRTTAATSAPIGCRVLKGSMKICISKSHTINAQICSQALWQAFVASIFQSPRSMLIFNLVRPLGPQHYSPTKWLQLFMRLLPQQATALRLPATGQWTNSWVCLRGNTCPLYRMPILRPCLSTILVQKISWAA